MTGKQISHFEILEELGRGGMGVVYAARDVRLGRTVALKFLPAELDADHAARERFTQEARAASALNHPNICTIHEIGDSDDGSIFIAMAFCAGHTLKDRIAAGPISPGEAVRVAHGLASGLAAAHRAGIVHRDVKPANLMVEEDGGVKILDFGLAKVADTRITRTGATLGTVEYMSPEQARGEEVDARSDVWSAGCVLYEMLSGHGPFEAPHDTAVVYRLMNEEPEPLELPDEFAGLGDIVHGCLRKDPDERYASAVELEAELARFDARENSLPRRRKVASWQVAALILLAVPAAYWIKHVVWPPPPDSGGVAFLPFRQTTEDTDACIAYGDLVSQQLGDLLLRSNSPFWVIPFSEVLKNDVTAASSAASELGAGLSIEGRCIPLEGSLEVDFQIVDTRRMKPVGEGSKSAPTSDLRAIADLVAAEIASKLPGRPERAAASLTRRAGASVPLAFQAYTRGRAAMLKGSDDDALVNAINELSRATSLDPQYAAALTLLGEALLTLDQLRSDGGSRLEEATEHFRAAVAADPDYVPARASLAEALRRGGDLPGAISEMNEAMSRDSTDWALLRRRANLLNATGHSDEAEHSFRRSVELQPDFWPLRLEYGSFLFYEGRVQEAREQFRVIEDLVPESYHAANAIAGTYNANQDLEAAEFYYRKAIGIQANYISFAGLAHILWDLQRYDESAAMYRQALATPGGDRNYLVWGNLAFSESAAGRPLQADSAFGVAIQKAQEDLARAPGESTIMMDLASYYVHRGQVDRALAYTDSVLEKSRDPFNWHSAASVFELAGRRDLALHWIEQALRVNYPVEAFYADSDLEALRSDPAFLELVRGDNPEELPTVE